VGELDGRAGPGVAGRAGPSGVTFGLQPTPQDLRDCIQAAYSGDDAEPWSVVEIYQFPEGLSPQYGGCRMPTTGGLSRLGIIQFTGVKDGDVPWVRYAGPSPVRYDKDSLPDGWPWDLQSGDRLGCSMRSPLAIFSEAGPLRVQDLADDFDNGDGCAIVEITRERAGSWFIRSRASDWWQDAYYIRLSAPLYATQKSPGIVRIEAGS